MESKSTRLMFLKRALEKILKEKDVKKVQHAELKKTCDETLERLEKDMSSNRKQGVPLLDSLAMLCPLELACKSKSPKIVSVALDCIQKLVSYQGASAADLSASDRTMNEKLVDIVSGCFIDSTTDTSVQLQVVKALLSIISNLEIHDASVLTAIRSCYNIYMSSHDLINQSTARGALTQMVNVIFQRMENEADLERKKGSNVVELCSVEEASDLPRVSETLTLHSGLLENTTPAEGRFQMPSPTPTPDLVNHKDTCELSSVSSEPISVINSCVYHVDRRTTGSCDNDEMKGLASVTSLGPDPAVSPGSDAGNITSDCREDARPDSETENQLSAGVDTISLEAPIDNPKIDEAKMLPEQQVVQDSSGGDQRTGPQTIHTTLLGTVVDTDGVSSTGESRRSSLTRAPKNALLDQAASRDSNETAQMVGSFTHVSQKDAFLVFRSLCKLAARPSDPKSKTLSLQLLLSCLQNAGAVFRTNETFIRAIQGYLCDALKTNASAPNADVFQICLTIFVELLTKFRNHLKAHIEMLFHIFILDVLEAPSQKVHSKLMSLVTVLTICNEAQTVVDLYVNYDCSIRAANLFERLVNVLSRIGQLGSPLMNNVQAELEWKTRKKAIECLVALLKCMVEWSRELYTNPTPQVASNIDSDSVVAALSASMHNVSAATSETVSAASLQMGVQGTDDPEHMECLKRTKDIREEGIKRFSKKCWKGIQYLQEHGILTLAAQDIAAFLFYEDRLDKTQVGELIGDGSDFAKDVMYKYVDMFSFRGRDLVQALRVFLEKFRLPGESQKIGRLMEKFAGRYFEENSNSGIFSSADNAYVLAYSIIMLTTDLHSVQVKKKMTKEQYINMNRGINDSKDLPREYLEKIYNDIAAEGITMSNQAATKISPSSATEENGDFVSATHVEHVKPMFKIAWTSVLAAFSVCLQDSDDISLVAFCLEGMRCAIRISCVFSMQLERDAFVQTLCKFSLLTTHAVKSEIRSKNVDCLMTLIAVAQADGNYLGNSWLEVLRCISTLDLLQVSGTASYLRVRGGSSAGAATAMSGQTGYSPPFSPAAKSDREPSSDMKKVGALLEPTGDNASQKIVVAVDRIFTGSIKLDSDAIVDFVSALCTVYTEEMANSNHAQMFCLRKIVEVTYYNMDRIRLEWSRIWFVLGDYFNKVGCSPYENVALFCVDSLRQLSMKFLEKGELANFHFQKEFLKPFEYITEQNISTDVRDMVVRCISQMVYSQAKNLKSGWKNVFRILRLAAAEIEEGIVLMAFQTINVIFEKNSIAIFAYFQDAVKCLSEFACNALHPDISIKSIRLIRQCAKDINDLPSMFKEHSLDDSGVFDADRTWVRAWFPVLVELLGIISRCKLDVRTSALTVMFDVMKSYGHTFQKNCWTEVFRLVLRIFDSMKLLDQQVDWNEKAEWMTTTCNHALFALVDVFSQYFDVLSDILLDAMFAQLIWCVQQDNELLARSGVNCLENLVVCNNAKFTSLSWDKTFEAVRTIHQVSTPLELISSSATSEHTTMPDSFAKPDIVATTVAPVGGAHMVSDDWRKERRDLSSAAIVEDPALDSNELRDADDMSQQSTSLASSHIYDSMESLYAINKQKLGSERTVCNTAVIKCIVQLELIQTLENIFFLPSSRKWEESDVFSGSMSPSNETGLRTLFNVGLYNLLSLDNIKVALDCLGKIHHFARQFNNDPNRGGHLIRSGLQRGRCRPNLLKQETASTLCQLKILFRMFSDEFRPDGWDYALASLRSTIVDHLDFFISMNSASRRESWSSVIILILSLLEKLPEQKFRQLIPPFYIPLCALVEMESRPELRSALRRVLVRVGTVYGLTSS